MKIVLLTEPGSFRKRTRTKQERLSVIQNREIYKFMNKKIKNIPSLTVDFV